MSGLLPPVTELWCRCGFLPRGEKAVVRFLCLQTSGEMVQQPIGVKETEKKEVM